jgi:hypothetical protein
MQLRAEIHATAPKNPASHQIKRASKISAALCLLHMP